MGTAERRQRERERKEREIIDAARELFLEKGYAAATMDDLVNKLEISKGGLYHHFPSKDEMFYAVALEGLTALTKSFAAAAAGEGDGLEKLTAIGHAYVRFWSERSDHRRLFRDLPLVSPPERSGPYGQEFALRGEESYRVMVGAIEQGIGDGSIDRNVDPRMLALSASASLDGVLSSIEKRAELGMSGPGRDALLTFTFDLFRKAIAGRPLDRAEKK